MRRERKEKKIWFDSLTFSLSGTGKEKKVPWRRGEETNCAPGSARGKEKKRRGENTPEKRGGRKNSTFLIFLQYGPSPRKRDREGKGVLC